MTRRPALARSPATRRRLPATSSRSPGCSGTCGRSTPSPPTTITGGSPEVVVGDVDTGLDFTHPDLAPNYDAANSTDCSSGTPQPLLPGNDVNGHGTHTAGTIAAAVNGIGIVGVAPNVKIAGIKSSNNDGFFFPEMVICSYMWVAAHGIDVTNNSYFADPWLFNCRNDAEQRAIWKAERRAIRHAQSNGHRRRRVRGQRAHRPVPSRESTSSAPTSRPAASRSGRSPTPARVVPVEVPGVVGVTATGDLEPEVVLLVVRHLDGRRGRARRRLDPAGDARRP